MDTDHHSRGANGTPIELERDDNLTSWHAAIVYKPVPAGTIHLSHGNSFDASANAGATGAALSDSPTATLAVSLNSLSRDV